MWRTQQEIPGQTHSQQQECLEYLGSLAHFPDIWPRCWREKLQKTCGETVSGLCVLTHSSSATCADFNERLKAADVVSPRLKAKILKAVLEDHTRRWMESFPLTSPHRLLVLYPRKCYFFQAPTQMNCLYITTHFEVRLTAHLWSDTFMLRFIGSERRLQCIVCVHFGPYACTCCKS